MPLDAKGNWVTATEYKAAHQTQKQKVLGQLAQTSKTLAARKIVNGVDPALKNANKPVGKNLFLTNVLPIMKNDNSLVKVGKGAVNAIASVGAAPFELYNHAIISASNPLQGKSVWDVPQNTSLTDNILPSSISAPINKFAQNHPIIGGVAKMAIDTINPAMLLGGGTAKQLLTPKELGLGKLAKVETKAAEPVAPQIQRFVVPEPIDAIPTTNNLKNTNLPFMPAGQDNRLLGRLQKNYENMKGTPNAEQLRTPVGLKTSELPSQYPRPDLSNIEQKVADYRAQNPTTPLTQDEIIKGLAQQQKETVTRLQSEGNLGRLQVQGEPKPLPLEKQPVTQEEIIRAAAKEQKGTVTRLQKFVQNGEVASQRLAERNAAYSNPNAMHIVARNPLDDLKDLSIAGAGKLAKGTLDFSQWSKEMVAEYGEIIRERLPYIWNKSADLLETGTADISHNGNKAVVKWPDATTPQIGETVLGNMGSQEKTLNATTGQSAPNTPFSLIDSGYDTTQSIKSSSEIKEPFKIMDKLKKVYTLTMDNRSIFKTVEKNIEKSTGKKLAADENMYTLGTNSSSAGGMAQTTLETHMVNMQGEVVGDSFKSVIEKATQAVGTPKNWKAFEDYNKLKHAMSWIKQGRDVYPEEAGLGDATQRISDTLEQIKKVKNDSTLDKEQKAYVVEQLQAGIDGITSQIEQIFIAPRVARIEQQFPAIADAGKAYSDWIIKFGEEWGVKSGLVDPEAWAAMRKEYPDYVPLQRVMDEVEEGLMGSGSGFANQSNPLKRGRGSKEDTVESIETMIDRIPSYIKTAKRNEVAQLLYNKMLKDPKGMEESWGKIVTVKPGDVVKKNVVTARVNGKEVSMELYNKDLLEGMSGLTPEGQGVLTEAVRKATNLMKTLTTGVNLLFSLGKNIFYDVPSAYAYSKTLSKIPGTNINNPVEFSVDLVDSLFRIVTNEKWNKEKYLQMYHDMGGGSFSSASADRNLMAESKARLMPGYISKDAPVKSLGRLANIGYQDLQKVMSTTETMPRLPEFKRVIQKEGNSYASRSKGLYEANDITFNFSRHGDVVKFADAYFPYLNAAVQGLDKFGRSAIENPLGLVANTAVAVMIPELVLYSVNYNDPNYQKLSEYVKSRYYCIPNGDGTFTKIVKPREIGVFGTALTDIMDYMITKEPSKFDSLKMGLANSFFPPTRMLSAPFADLKSNTNFAGTPIVPGYLQGLSPQYQSDANTSEPAKALGKLIKQSPKQIDYLAKSYGGVLAQIGQPLTTDGGSLGKVLQRQFTADPVYSNDIFTKFYNERTKLTTAYDNVKAGNPDPADDKARRIYFNHKADKISKVRKNMRELENDKTVAASVKEKSLREMQQEMIDIANEALNRE